MTPSNPKDALAWAALLAVVAATACSTDAGGGGADASGDGSGPGPDGGPGGSSSSSGGGSGSSSSGSSGGSSGVGGGSGGSNTGGSGSSSSSGAGIEASVPRKYDGTVGMPCQMSADCEPPGGVGVNVCSNAAFPGGPFWPTAVCLLMHCDPVGSGGGGSLQYCDGPASDPTSPGVCLPTTSPAQPGMGICLPRCELKLDGSAPTGCRGKDVCNAAGLGTSASGDVVGVGYCFGGCTADADCPAGSQCQLDEGTCLTTLYSRTKMLGQGCTSADSASTNHACLCGYSAATNQGYCTQACIVGGAACPSGYVCSTGEALQLTGLGADGGTIPGFASQNIGMAGLCRAVCHGSGDAGGTCPPNSSCNTGDTVGPVCAP